MKKTLFIVIALAAILSFGIAEAVQTRLVIRAKSKDAKFVGTSMGGALVVISDTETGKMLAKGLTAGSTGNTKKIMLQPHGRGIRITDDSTAKFEAVIDIEEPRLVTIEVEAPYGMKPKTVKASTQVWLIPGKKIAGEGIIIEVSGFSVDATAAGNATLTQNRAVIPIQARIVMI